MKFCRTFLSIRYFTLVILFIAGTGSVTAQYSPQRSFGGSIGKTLGTSKPEKVPYNPIASPQAPNVIYILLDDVGFGASSAFGGLIHTPVFDSLANNGLRYTNFHTTAMCSPTRASLLTGRNSHSVHMGFLIDGAVDYPGYDAHMPLEKGTAAEILRENGYNTFAVGKWHVTAYEDVSQAGPFNRWPTGRGFEHYYGFLGGETDEYYPQLWENTAKIEPARQGQHLTTLLIDKAIGYISDQKSVAPKKPFFLYLTPGATHAPHQVDKKWIDLYKGKFDGGWDKYREAVLANQKKMGLIPSDAQLPPLNEGVRPWDSLTTVQRKLFPHFMEAYAGFLTQTDYEIGRLVNFLREIGQLNNTVIFLMIGDNGASKEGELSGITEGVPEQVYLNAMKSSGRPGDSSRVRKMLQHAEEIGTIHKAANYPWGWALAANTPYRYWKTDANAEGGTHNPLIVFYPDGIKEKGGIRTQYLHVSDILPTTVDLVGAVSPAVIGGYKQDSLEGVSFAASLQDAHAEDRHRIQYYELYGSRSVYKEGWKAEVYHERGKSFENDRWELYDLEKDFNERHDLAAQYPDKLKDLQALFESEAKKYNVYPLKGDQTMYDLARLFGKKDPVTLYNGVSQLSTSTVPSLYFRSFTITSDLEFNSVKDEGVLFAIGGRFNGLSIYVKGSKVRVAHNIGEDLSYLESGQPIKPGKALIRYEFRYSFLSKGDTAGTEALYINDQKVAGKAVVKKQGLVFEYDEGIDVGKDNQSAVTPEYNPPFAFTGRLKKVVIEYK